jgi:hypothetical protein
MTQIQGGPGFDLQVVNGRLVRQGLENFAKAIPDIGRLRIYRAMQHIFKRLGDYPPQRVGSKYVRTDNLRDSRVLSKLPDGYQITNDPVTPIGHHYAIYVRGDISGQGQAGNAADWPLLSDIIDSELKTLPSEVIQDLRVATSALAEEVNQSE